MSRDQKTTFFEDLLHMIRICGEAHCLEPDRAVFETGLFLCALAFKGRDRNQALEKAAQIYEDCRARHPQMWRKTRKKPAKTPKK